ncbi:hypothetical protein USB125703_00884 [Pseudoclavibacter triregionum]|nr:hypothetical protein USB125703_00884 [Pseudoclavibacter triregionum]
MAGAGMLGADTDALRAIARRFDARGGEVGGVPATTDPELAREELWRGEDAERFRAAWKAGPSTALPRLGELLAALGRELVRQAGEQDACSSAGRAGAGGAAGSGAGGAGPFGVPSEPIPNAPGGPDPADPAPTVRDLAAIQDPAERRRAWEALDEATRGAAIQADPGGIGSLDGIPLADRADANEALAERILAEGGQGLGERELRVVEKVASGELRAVLFDPHRGDLVQMLGEPGPGTTMAILWAPPTGASMLDFDGGGYLGIPNHLAQMHPDAVVFVYQRGDWSQKIAPIFGEAERYSNDPRVAANNGAQLAAFQQAAIATDPFLATARQAGMGFSYGHSVISEAEVHGARFDRVASVAGANMPLGWQPTEGTRYANFEHVNDMLNIPQGAKTSRVPFADLVMPGLVPDVHPAYEQHDYGYYSDKPAITFPERKTIDTRLGPVEIPWGKPGFNVRHLDIGEAHANIAQAGPTNEKAVRDMEEFLFGK